MTEQLVEVTSCQLCGGREAATMFAEPPYRVQRCARCSFVWVSPRWHDDALHEVYDHDYWNSDNPKTKGYADYAREEELYLKTFRKRRRLVERHCPAPARVLDIGCAAGYFLRVMRDAGHDVYGIELSAAIAHRAVEHLGPDRVFCGAIGDAPAATFRPGSFDLVTLWDVIEHVPDPQRMLDQCHALLKPGGVLILETQNVDSAFARVLGPRWHHYKHEEHIYHFNPATIRDLLEQRGFRVEHTTARYGGKYVSFEFVAERAARVNRLLAVALRPLTWLGRGNVYLNFRDEIIVVACAAGDRPPPASPRHRVTTTAE